MALTPTTNEAFLREVDEELRRERAIGLWRRYGRLLVAAVVIGLLVFAGVLFWHHRQRQAAAAEGLKLQQAFDALGADKATDAARPLADLAGSKREGYRALALFTQADVLLQKDDRKGAAAKFAAVAGDASMPAPFRDLALIRQTTAEFDELAPDAVASRLKGLAVKGNPYFGSAGELVAAAYLQSGKRDLAARLYGEIAKDADVPETIRQRAVQMAGVMGVDAVSGAKAAK